MLATSGIICCKLQDNDFTCVIPAFLDVDDIVFRYEDELESYANDLSGLYSVKSVLLRADKITGIENIDIWEKDSHKTYSDNIAQRLESSGIVIIPCHIERNGFEQRIVFSNFKKSQIEEIIFITH